MDDIGFMDLVLDSPSTVLDGKLLDFGDVSAYLNSSPLTALEPIDPFSLDERSNDVSLHTARNDCSSAALPVINDTGPDYCFLEDISRRTPTPDCSLIYSTGAPDSEYVAVLDSDGDHSHLEASNDWLRQRGDIANLLDPSAGDKVTNLDESLIEGPVAGDDNDADGFGVSEYDPHKLLKEIVREHNEVGAMEVGAEQIVPQTRSTVSHFPVYRSSQTHSAACSAAPEAAAVPLVDSSGDKVSVVDVSHLTASQPALSVESVGFPSSQLIAIPLDSSIPLDPGTTIHVVTIRSGNAQLPQQSNCVDNESDCRFAIEAGAEAVSESVTRMDPRSFAEAERNKSDCPEGRCHGKRSLEAVSFAGQSSSSKKSRSDMDNRNFDLCSTDRYSGMINDRWDTGQRKRQQNREAATRYRQKKKTAITNLTEELNEISDKNKSLKRNVRCLEMEVDTLKKFMLEVRARVD